MLISQVCKQQDFESVWLQEACLALKEPLQYHRKLWEYCYIYQGLLERGMLGPGRRGLGFGVGKEPLASLFASRGCYITATDLDAPSASVQGWAQSNMHAVGIQDLNERGLCDPKLFRQRVTFEVVNMNAIPPHLFNQFDFTWSSCSFEHCGSIALGKQFILNQMNCLKPGGVAIHTTEFNLSSNDQTLEEGPTVLFRLKDIEWMVHTLRAQGHSIEVDYSVGTGPIDRHIDVPPHSNPHLRLLLAQYVTTSIGLIIEKAK